MPTSRTRSRTNHISDDDTATMSRPRSRSRRSHSLTAEAERRVIKPAKRAVNSARRSVSRTVSGLPGWVPWVAGGIGVCALVYGLLQIEAVRDFARSATEPISDLFSDDDFEDDDYFEGSDYGDNAASGL